MVDTLSKEQRRKNMQAIRSQSKLENQVSREIWKRGLRFRKNDKSLFGKPDISIKKYKIVIFIDSCFWHSCPIHGNMPKTNVEYWEKKLNKNIRRDLEVNQYYKEKGWNVLRIWEHNIKKDFQNTIEQIIEFIRDASGKIDYSKK